MVLPTRAVRAADGFSLVEMLVTLGLLGVVSTIAATNFHAYVPTYRARGAALMVAGDMNVARLSAIKESRRYYLVPMAGTSYQIRADDPGGGPTVVLKTVDAAADYPGIHFAATGIANDPYGNPIGAAVPGGQMIFNSDGTIANAGGIYVETDGDPPHAAQHGVLATAAGRIRIWRWDGTTWN